MKILHIISQAPDFTGSGKSIRQILRQSAKKGHENFLVAGVQADFTLPEDLVEPDHCSFVRFDNQDLNFPIPGMSDVMPYESRIFSQLCQDELSSYQKVFETKIREAVQRFKPDILHTHHLWIVSAIARRISHGIPMVTSCHGTCLRQHALCPKISSRIKDDLKKIDHVIALSQSQKKDIARLEARLAGLLEKTIHEVIKDAEPDWEYACARTLPYTWDKVFSKIERVYKQASCDYNRS